MVNVELTPEQLWEIIKALKMKAEHCRKGYRRHPGPERLEQIVLIEGLIKDLIRLHQEVHGELSEIDETHERA
jgi:hypothetical protein